MLLDGKLCVILFIVGDSVCLSLRWETEAGFLVIVLVGNGKSLKAKGSGDIISFERKLIFCYCSVFSVFFLILLEKSYPFSSESPNTQKRRLLSLHIFSASFFTSRPR